MSKAFTFIIFSAVILGMFMLFGIGNDSNTTTSQLLNAVGFNKNISETDSYNGNFFTQILSTTSGKIAALGLGGAIVASFFVGSAAIYVITASIIVSLGNWLIGDLLIISSTMRDNLSGEMAFMGYIIWVFITVYIIGAFVALLSLWQGSDG